MSLALRDLEDLLLLDKPPVKSAAPSAASKKGAVPPEAPEPYNREKYKRYAADKGKAFRELYAFCFALAKPPYVPAVPYVVLS